MLAFPNIYYVFTIVRKMDFSCSVETSSQTHTNDGYLCHFVHSDNQFVFTMTLEYIIYERSGMAVLHSLDYDVNIEK